MGRAEPGPENVHILLVSPKYAIACKQHIIVTEAFSSYLCGHFLSAFYSLMPVYLFAGSWKSATTE